MHADLVIVGAGMVGSALALALEGSGLEVLLVDGGSLDVAPFKPEAPYEPRVSALSEASRRILQRLHAWDGIVARRAEPYREMQVWDGSGTGRIGFSAASVHAEVLGHIVENRVVQDALLERLRERDLMQGLLTTLVHEVYTHGEVEYIHPLYKEWFSRDMGVPAERARATVAWVTVHTGGTESNHFAHATAAVNAFVEAMEIEVNEEAARNLFGLYLRNKAQVMRDCAALF